jgi:hypothetical protein
MNMSNQTVNREAIALYLWKRDRFAMREYASEATAKTTPTVELLCPSRKGFLCVPIKSPADVAAGTTCCPTRHVRILLVADEVPGVAGLFWKTPRIYARR